MVGIGLKAYSTLLHLQKKPDLIKRKQKTYTDVWNHQTVAESIGLVDGKYCLTKELRGII